MQPIPLGLHCNPFPWVSFAAVAPFPCMHLGSLSFCIASSIASTHSWSHVQSELECLSEEQVLCTRGACNLCRSSALVEECSAPGVLKGAQHQACWFAKFIISQPIPLDLLGKLGC